MRELILGLGQQTSLRAIAARAEGDITEKIGVPRIIKGQGNLIKFTVEREAFEGEFDSFLLKIDATAPFLEAALKAAEGLKESCAHSEEDGWHVFRCPPEGSSDADAGREAIDTLCEEVRLPEIWRLEGGRFQVEPISIELIFKAMLQYKASDVHLSPGKKPIFRVDNEAHNSELMGDLSAEQITSIIREITPDDAWSQFEEHKQCSFNYHQVGLGYARTSAFIKSGAPHLTFRYLPEKIPSFEELDIPEATMVQLANMHHGLVLISGMTGSGKTTTSAALVDWINSNRLLHILSIEDPVEYVHRNKKSFISQRNLGRDVNSFGEGVEGALRHDPDVIVIGEMRDPDTIRGAISAASTGHLVISTIHSSTASMVVNRIVSFFDPVERDLVKLQLRDSLECVICQRLIPRKTGGRIPALEILFNDIKPISDGILHGLTDEIRIGMQQTVSHSFLFEKYLDGLEKKGTIDLETARAACTDVSVFDQMHMGTYSVPRLESMVGGH